MSEIITCFWVRKRRGKGKAGVDSDCFVHVPAGPVVIGQGAIVFNSKEINLEQMSGISFLE